MLACGLMSRVLRSYTVTFLFLSSYRKYAGMWVDEEGVEKKLDMGMKLSIQANPDKPDEEDPFAKVPTSMATYRNFEVSSIMDTLY